MSLSDKAKEILVVAMTNKSKGEEIADAIDTSTLGNTTNVAATALNTTHRTSTGVDHANVVLNDSHRTGDGSDHANVALNDAARNENYRLIGMMIAANNDATTDATTLGVLIDDFIVEVDIAGGGVIGSGIAVADNTFVGAVTVGSVLLHYRPIV